MAHSPFESWKRHAPSNRDEAQAADLINKLGEAETLSPQALHRVAHGLRSPARRPLSLFSDVRLAGASVAALLLFVVGAWATIGYFDRQQPTDVVLAAPRRAVQQMVAQNDVRPAAPSAEMAPEATAPAGRGDGPHDGLRLEEPQLGLDAKAERRQRLAKGFDDAKPGESGFAQPPSGWPPRAAGRENALAAKKAQAPAERAELAMREQEDQSATDPRARASADRSAAPPTAGAVAAPLAPATVAAADSQAAPSEGAALTGMTVEGCRSSMPADSATLARNSGDVEQALFRHGVCLLLLSKREAGTADLRAYLARYPNGRFAEGVRALLVKSPGQTPTR